jgi:hypothetical protein
MERSFMMVEEAAAKGVFEANRIASHSRSRMEDDAAEASQVTENWIKEIFTRETEFERGRGHFAELTSLARLSAEILRQNELLLSQMSEAVRREDMDGAFAAAACLAHVSRAREEWIHERRTSMEENTREEGSSLTREIMLRAVRRTRQEVNGVTN